MAEESKLDELSDKGSPERVPSPTPSEFGNSSRDNKSSDNSEIDDKTNQGTNDDKDDGFEVVQGKKAKNKATTGIPSYGIKLIRKYPVTPEGAAGYKLSELQMLFRLISTAFPGALIRNHKDDPKSETTAMKLSLGCNDYLKFLDMYTHDWGRRDNNMSCTNLLFYIRHKDIDDNLIEFKNHPVLSDFIGQRKLIVSRTLLHSSNTKCVAYIMAKDSKYAYRDELNARLQKLFDVPIQCSITKVVGKDYHTWMLGIFVANSDIPSAKETLKSNPDTHFQVLFFNQKRSNIQAFTASIKQHDMITSCTRAFKITEVEDSMVDMIRTLIMEDPSLGRHKVLDVSKGRQPGVVYVQYLMEHKEDVLPKVEEAIQSLQSETSKGPNLHNPAFSVDMTAATKATMATKGYSRSPEEFPAIDLPMPKRHVGIKETYIPRPKSVSLDMTNLKSYSSVAKGNNTTDKDSHNSQSTLTADNTKLTKRTIELQERNLELEEELERVKMQALAKEQELKREMQEMRLMMHKLQQQMSAVVQHTGMQPHSGDTAQLGSKHKQTQADKTGMTPELKKRNQTLSPASRQKDKGDAYSTPQKQNRSRPGRGGPSREMAGHTAPSAKMPTGTGGPTDIPTSPGMPMPTEDMITTMPLGMRPPPEPNGGPQE